MGFIDKYVYSVNSADLRDDEHHHATEALVASALADIGGTLGAQLARVKYSDGSAHKAFEAGSRNLAPLLRAWEVIVRERGKSRQWLPQKNTAWDIQAAEALYRRVAHASLAYWIDPNCTACKGAKQTPDRRICETCKGSGQAALPVGGLERERTLDMVSELQDCYQSYNRRAAKALRKEES
jgi:hypothetical protein